MAKVVARIKAKGKHYEIHVDLDEALKLRAGKGDINSAVDSTNVFYDLQSGKLASKADLCDAFGTSDFYEIAKIIITKGEVQKTQEFRDEQKEARIKQVISIIIKNAVDQHGRPYTEERIRRGLEEVKYVFDSKPADQQAIAAVDKLKTIIPIRIETKRIKIIVPARYTGQAYGIFKENKESEEWLPNGDLQVIMDIPSGMQIEFYDKLNSITHGACQTQELGV